MSAVSNPVESRAKIIQDLQRMGVEANEGKLPTPEAARELYIKVYEEVYKQISTPGITVPAFWNKALELAGRLVFESNWEEIHKRVQDRLAKMSGSKPNQTEPNQPEPNKERGSDAN